VAIQSSTLNCPNVPACLNTTPWRAIYFNLISGELPG
jgi:hypothetical protein